MDLSDLSAQQRVMLELLLRRSNGKPPSPASNDWGERLTPIPLSFAQQRLWFMVQLDPDNAFYNLYTPLRLEGKLEVPALYRALRETLMRHEVLRTMFSQIDGCPYQVIRTDPEFAMPTIDLNELPSEQQEEALDEIATKEASASFDLERDLLFRARLVRLGENDHALLTTMHHIVSDGLSVSIFTTELAAAYQALCDGCESPFEALPKQYADYACWQRQWLQGDVLERQLSYWRKQLKGAPEALRLPIDRPRPLIQGFCGARHEFTLPRELTSALRELSNRRDVTLFMTLLAAYNALLRSFTGQNDILVGTPVAGRERPGTEPMIGLFANILVLRTDLSGSPTFLDLLDRVRNTALEAFAHQDVPFEKLVDELEPNRSLSHNPLFQVAFVLDQPSAPPVRLRELTVQRLETRDKTAQFDLVLHMIDLGSQLFGSLQYNTELFDARVIRLSRQFERTLNAIVEDPEIRLDEVDDLLHRFDLEEQQEKEKRLSEASLAKLKNVRRKQVPLRASASDS